MIGAPVGAECGFCTLTNRNVLFCNADIADETWDDSMTG